MWENAVKNTPKESTDQLGPSHSRLRVPMPKEEYVDLANVVEHGKDFVMESKKRKIGNAEDVAQAEGMLCTGHASFGNSMFDAVGGNLAAQHIIPDDDAEMSNSSVDSGVGSWRL